MRPVDRGEPPTEAREWTHYREACAELEDRLGSYCSYCELPLTHAPHVEHVQPKSCRPDLATEWDNLLLACANCNSCKGDEDVRLSDFLWPDRDNTARAFEYEEGGAVSVRPDLDSTVSQRAQRTLFLLGLHRHETVSDRRRRWRRDARDAALCARAALAVHDTETMRGLIQRTAVGYGFFSVWLAVFRDDSDMCRRLITTFPGTAHECFDEDGGPVDSVAREGTGL